jgi:hypothetical protein
MEATEWPKNMYTLFTLYFTCQSVYTYFWATLYFEIIQHFGFAYIFVWVRKLDFESLTETNN